MDFYILSFIILPLLTLSSFILNSVLYQKNKLLQKKIKEVSTEKRVLTVDAERLIHDMTVHGNAIVRIIPLSPADVFYRSPNV